MGQCGDKFGTGDRPCDNGVLPEAAPGHGNVLQLTEPEHPQG